MEKSPVTKNSHQVFTSILVDGNEIHGTYQVLYIDVERAINRIAKATIILKDGRASEQNFDISETDDFVPGKVIEIKAGYGAERARLFKGIIVKHRVKVKGLRSSQLILHCYDEALKMTVARRNKYFEKVKDSELIGQILGANDLQKRVDNTLIKHPKVVQYYVTDWDFLLTRAELNGMIVVTDDGTVRVNKPKLSERSELKVTYGVDMVDFDAEIDARTQVESVSCVAWDVKRQEVITGDSKEPSVNEQSNLKGKTLAEVLKVKNYQLQTTAPITTEGLKTWANAELLKSRLAKIQGKMRFKGSSKAKPDTTIELAGLGVRFNGIAYISSVRHELERGNWITEVQMGLSPEWFVEENPDIKAPPASGLIAAIEGLQIGKVKKIEGDPNGETRVLVDVPVIEKSGVGVWARLANLYATKDAGTFFMPEEGDEVILGFLNNDPRYAVILGSLYNNKYKSPFKPDRDNSKKAIVTKNKLQMVFHDKDKIIEIATPKGNKIILDDKEEKLTIEDSNNNKIEMSSSGILMDSPKDIVLKAKGKIVLDALQKMNLTSKSDIDVTGLNVTNSAKVNFSATGKARAELKAAAQTIIKGAMVMIN